MITIFLETFYFFLVYFFRKLRALAEAWASAGRPGNARENPTCLLWPLALWQTSTSPLIYIHQTEEAGIRSISEFFARRLTSWCFNSGVRQRQGGAAETNPDYQEKLPACNPEQRRSIRLLEFQKESFWVDVSVFFAEINLSAHHKRLGGSWHFTYFKSYSQSFWKT